MYTRDVRCEWTLVTVPQQEPLSEDEAKLHCTITHQDENLLIASFLKAAREAAERHMNRGLFTQTWKLQLSDFADVIWLPMASPLQNDALANPSTAPVVQYYDADGALQTLATTFYDVDTTSTPGRIVRKPNQTYPSVQTDRLAAVFITYVVGWTNVESVPELIKQGLRYYVAAKDADRLGGSVDAAAAVKAAENEWDRYGVVYWREPVCLR